MLLQWKENLSLPLRVSMKYLLRDLGQQNARRWIDYRFALEGKQIAAKNGWNFWSGF